MKIRSNSSKLNIELIDKVNPVKSRYRQRPIFDLIDFYNSKEEGYFYLTVVTIGDRNGASILVYQIDGPSVTLEKVSDYIYKYKDPEDEIYTERLFEVEVIIDNTDSKKKQTKVISDPSVYYLTSQIYPINLVEEAYTSSKGITGRILTTNDLRLYQSIFEDGFTSLSKITGIFKQSLFLYDYKNEDNNTFDPVKTSINRLVVLFRELLKVYVVPIDNSKISISRINGVMRQLLIQYNFYIPEILKSNVNKVEASSFYFNPYHEIFINGNTTDYNPNDSDNGVTIIQKSTNQKIVNNLNDKGISYKTYNTSVLDFENGLVDRVNSGITWNKAGTADINTTNKLYSTSSFETKALGDSLYTNSNVITGGSTPFTVEFYSLIKGSSKNASGYEAFTYPVISKNNNGSNGEQCFSITNNMNPMFSRYSSPSFAISGNYKINLNEINKHQITYDGSAIRWFVNDELRLTIGTSIGLRMSNSVPFTFYRHSIPAYPAHDTNTHGIIDNINIHDSIATKVRNADPYEEYLVVDLAFDGENNSTKIVDNGTLKSNWTVNGNAKISTDQKFDGFSSLDCTVNGSYIATQTDLDFRTSDYTISFDFYPTSNAYTMLFSINNLGARFTINPSNRIYTDLDSTQTGTINTVNLNATNSCIIIFYKDNNYVDIYLNGILTRINISKSYLTPSDFRIGHDIAYPNNTLKGYIKNFKIYKGVAIPPKQKIISLINLNISSSSVNSNLTWNISSAIVNNDYFTGYLLNTSGNSAFTFYGSNFILKYKFKGYGNLLKEWNNNLRYMLTIDSSGVVSFNFYETGPTQRTITTNSQTLSSDINELELTRSNGYFFIKLNGIPYTVTQTGAPYSGNIYGPTTEGVRLGDTGVTTYSIDIYTKKSEDLDKIELNFDNNVVDKYGNSTWTNNGVTFDNVNSIKGSAGYFNGSSNLQLNNNSLLNFGNKNFNIEFDGNKLNNNQTYSSWLTPNGASYPSQWCELSSWNTNLQRFQNLAASAPELTGAVLNLNTWYKWQLTRNNGTVILKANDVVTGISNYTPSMNVNFSNGTGTNLIGVSSNAMNCYMDNFKSEKDYKGEIIIDKPAVHLPLETNSINTGFTPLTINSVGNPTYTTVDGKKCIKFESGKYLTINNNNIFNLGANSDFYIEFDFYPIKDRPAFVLFCSGSSVVDSNLFTITCAELFLGEYNKVYTHLAGTNYIFPGSFIYDSWNNLIIFRKGNITTYVLNDLSISFNNDMTFNYASNSNLTYIGNAAYASTIYYNGYMSNFKMFVGTSEIPETYNDKAVLDLDFKPTRKSYLFKDNNNKCVIHPVNITQRDYQDSQYCCTFNGTDQYLQLGKNDLLNFGNDDFMIYIKFKPLSISTIKVLLNSGETSSVENRFGILLNTNGTIFIHTQYNGNYYYFSTSNSVILNEINHLVVYKQNGQLYVVLNNITTTNSILNNYLINLNVNGNTYVGFRAISDSPFYFNGQIYSIKVLRNTTDTSVLNLPILNTPSTIYLPLIKDSIDIKTGATWTNNASRVVYENEAAKFDGNSATYLNTGVTSDFNYATNDFTVGFDTYKSGNQSEARILSSVANNPSIYPRTEIKQSQGMGLTLSNYTNSSEVMYKTYKTGDVLNNWNKSRFIKTNNTLYTYINDSLVDMVTVPNGTQFNLNTNNGTRISGVGYTASSSYFYQGYIKNVYSNSIATTSDILPYLYMPYDTSLTDFGVNNLSITNSTTSASVLDTLNGVKCTRITTVSTNPYITMTLGSVFTIKAKIYIPTKASSGYHKPLFGTGYNSNIGFLLSQFTEPWSGNANPQLWLRTSGSNISFAINGLIGTWIDIIVTKTLTTLTLNVNGVDVGSMNNSNWNNSDFESSRTFYIGDAGTDWKESSTFYIKDFRFYKGLPSIPTNEVLSKKVLDLKFKKDDARVYPFKDESRRHIVSYNAMSKYNLVNIEGVDCAQFNGVNQYLELGDTKLMNFGNEDFVIAFKIYIVPYVHTGSSQWQVILASGGTSPSSNVNYIAYDQTTKSLVIRATDNEVYRISNVLNEYAWNTVIITRTADKFNTIINNNINNSVISSTANFNLNYNANTYIGIDKWNTSNEYLKGYLADLQIVKGSSDTSLIDVNTTETITIVNPPKAIYYPIKLNEVDSFSNSWYQTNATNPVRLKEYNKGVNTSMYFDGISGLQSNNTFNRIGLSPFTVECSILIDSPINVSYPMSIFSYGKDYNRPEWFNLEVTSTGVIRFCINKSTNEYVSSPVATINYNTKYNIAVTRDADYNLRIFVNGVIVANQVVTNCFDSYSQNSGYSYTTSSNWLVIGKQGPYWNRTDPSLGGFKGNIENFHYLVGTCKYTSNYTPSINETIKLETMSLVNADVAMGTNPSTIPDTRNNIVYTNNGCTVEALAGQLRPYSIRCQTTSNRLISSVNEIMFNLGTLNWTIDLTFRPMQTSAEAYLLDTRANSTIFRGLVIRQPQTNPTTLMIEIGSSNAASAFENTYQTAANSLVVNTTYHLRLVRCIDVILVFWNGTLLTTINYGVKDIGYSNKIILFNNDLFTKGFNGYVTQFRFIKGISTDVFAFPQITQELK